MPDPADLTLAEAASAIAGGELAPAELVEACLRRAGETAGLGAWVVRDPDGARRSAREVRTPAPLAGIPVAVKDNADVAGWPTRVGTAASDPAPARRDAALVADLRATGAVLLGKVATHEITYGVTTRSVANPREPGRLAGGSSGGSAVAVATGAVPLAVGSDTAGSVRIPAALCGVAGVMGPRLSLDGFRPLAPGLDTAGLLARSTEDLAVAWRALTGEGEPPAPRRVGIPAPAALGSIDEDVARAVAAAVARLAGAGPELVEVEVPDFGEFARARATVIAADALAVQRSAGAWPDRAASFGEAVRSELERAEGIDAAVLDAARGRHRELGARLRAALDAVDVLAWPTTPCVAPPADDGEPPARADRRLAGVLTRLCGPVNAAGLAAVSVPCGRGSHGLPVGLQLVARSEVLALGAALAYEAATGA